HVLDDKAEIRTVAQPLREPWPVMRGLDLDDLVGPARRVGFAEQALALFADHLEVFRRDGPCRERHLKPSASPSRAWPARRPSPRAASAGRASAPRDWCSASFRHP